MKWYRVALLATGVGLLSASFWMSTASTGDRLRHDQDRRLAQEAASNAKVLDEYFDRARTVLLLTASNAVFDDFVAAPGSIDETIATGGPVVERVHAALLEVESLYPDDAVSEVCFIGDSGVEMARAVRSHVALPDELSDDESENAFFASTLPLATGEVRQAEPYRSPDTGLWVISNSTMIDVGSGERAMVHFEVALDSFRSELAVSAGGRVAIVEAADGAVVLDANRVALGISTATDSDGTSYTSLAGAPGRSGVVTIDGRRVAYHRVGSGQLNDNDWFVTVSAPVVASAWYHSVGLESALVLVAGLVVMVFVLSSFRASQRRLRDAALTDHLTGLPNRTLLYDRIGAGLRLAERQGTMSAVMICDLDRFKEVNDTLGHHKGDVLLVEVARRLAGAVRASDTVARLGGDEFAVFLPGLEHGSDAQATAGRIVKVLTDPVVIDGMPIQVGASVGIAVAPAHGRDVDTLMQHADIAMYDAKRTRGGFHYYADTDELTAERRLVLAGELSAAIAEGGLVVHYQPKIDLESGEMIGVEALTRWRHRHFGDVSPVEFISIAEDTGLIRALTLKVLSDVLVQCREWRDAGLDHHVAVNLSARCLMDVDLPREVEQLLHDIGLEGSVLTLEITETAIIIDHERAATILDALHELGISLSIDDFGTGYFSMSALRDLPIDEIKIDRSFVSSMTTQEKDNFIVQSTIALGKNLGYRVVAEGVEDRATLEQLRLLGCDSAQGFLMSPAIPACELRTWLAGWHAQHAARVEV